MTTEDDHHATGSLLDGRYQCGHATRIGPHDEITNAANVRAAPITCPKCRGKSVVPLVDPDHGCEDDEAFPSCQASEPLMEESFACPMCGKRQLRFRFAGLWD